MDNIFKFLSGVKGCLSFVLHVLGLAVLYAINLRGVDTSSAVVGLVISYGSTQTAKQISAHVNASKDPQADTQKAIETVNDK